MEITVKFREGWGGRIVNICFSVYNLEYDTFHI